MSLLCETMTYFNLNSFRWIMQNWRFKSWKNYNTMSLFPTTKLLKWPAIWTFNVDIFKASTIPFPRFSMVFMNRERVKCTEKHTLLLKSLLRRKSGPESGREVLHVRIISLLLPCINVSVIQSVEFGDLWITIATKVSYCFTE